jgi:predicted HicB family RNase H-like nuclease
MTNEPTEITLVVEIDDELYTRLLIAANRQGVSTSDFASLALSEYLRNEDAS